MSESYSINSTCQNPDIGTLRESFFSGVLSNAGHILTASKKGDFIVDEEYIFEVGGKTKGYKQIKNVQHSYVVADGIEVGSGNKIPLYLFGFLY